LIVQSFDTTIAASLEDIEPKVRAALQEQGFGVLTEIDVAATLRCAVPEGNRHAATSSY
jgi:uncharacterized protein (DUF302 family)